ncbi:hypothetical protein M427DRAFT_365593 [Gonapodya prolifera JEL478]|uniref:Uncharacterized protein n=1 Tax=Gonapodya prolifera (strain JEL478) TaxID=1344416 RepID=A0A139AA78_GONPJ|nr:hypothetical protein M427DRAFT_365593 [Gonapodya prolifera JEL478]|eukprot:KXS13640.1 hypothetical protein M427DRAFT_365593 [Gonapodya prolifera JEL478]
MTDAGKTGADSRLSIAGVPPSECIDAAAENAHVIPDIENDILDSISLAGDGGDLAIVHNVPNQSGGHTSETGNVVVDTREDHESGDMRKDPENMTTPVEPHAGFGRDEELDSSLPDGVNSNSELREPEPVSTSTSSELGERTRLVTQTSLVLQNSQIADAAEPESTVRQGATGANVAASQRGDQNSTHEMEQHIAAAPERDEDRSSIARRALEHLSSLAPLFKQPSRLLSNPWTPALVSVIAVLFTLLFHTAPSPPPPLPEHVDRSTLWSAFDLLRNPYAELSAERWEKEWSNDHQATSLQHPSGAKYWFLSSKLNSTGLNDHRDSSKELEARYYIPITWSRLLHSQTSSTVALVFGPRGMGKSTLRILAEKKFRAKWNSVVGDGTPYEWDGAPGKGKGLLIDITPERHSLNTFFPTFEQHIWHTARPLMRIFHTRETYWKLNFETEFNLGDFADMILGRGVTILVDGVVSGELRPKLSSTELPLVPRLLSPLTYFFHGLPVPPLGLAPSTAVQLGAFAASYYMGHSDSLRSFLDVIDRDLAYGWWWRSVWDWMWDKFQEHVTSAKGSLMALAAAALTVIWVNFTFADPLRILRNSRGVVTRVRIEVLMLVWVVWCALSLYWSVAPWFSLHGGLNGVWESLTTGAGNLFGEVRPLLASDFRTMRDPGELSVERLVRVIPHWDARTKVGAPYVKECARMNVGWKGDTAIGRLKRFRKVIGEVGIGEMAVLVDGIDETSLSAMGSYPRIVQGFTRAVIDHALFEMSMEKDVDTSFWFFFPRAFKLLVNEQIKEKGRLDKYGWVDLTFDHRDLLRMAELRFQTYQTCAITVTGPELVRQRNGPQTQGSLINRRHQLSDSDPAISSRPNQVNGLQHSPPPCDRSFWSLFCDATDEDHIWVDEAFRSAAWLRTPRLMTTIMRDIVELLAKERWSDMSDRPFCVEPAALAEMLSEPPAERLLRA